MATVTWIGNAHDTKQISTITVANTWAAGDTATMTINGKDIVVTVGTTGTSTANVAIALKEAWNASTRLDGTGTTDSTSNAGGQEFGEFAEATASVSSSVVTIIANKAGVPFTLSVTENTAGTGTATGATAQAATGKMFWDNGDNWDGGAAPSNDDTVVFRDSDVSVKYGLPNASKEVTIQQWMSYTGEIGLPEINRDDPSKPYHEYRQRYVRLDDAGTGTDIAHRFGLGKDGIGSSLINLKHTVLKCSPIVYNTGPAKVDRVGSKALNLCCTNTSSTLNIVNGSVDCGTQDGGAPALTTIRQTNGSLRCFTGTSSSTGATIAGGEAVFGGSAAIGAIQAINSGKVRIEGQSAAITNLGVADSAVMECPISGVTVTSLICNGGTFDATGGGTFTVTQAEVYEPASFYDPSQRITYTNPVKYYGELSSKLKFGGTSSSYLLITP